MRNIKAVIFDIDDTLTTRNSWHFLATELGVSAEEELDNWNKFSTGKITQEESDKRVLEMWRSKDNAYKENFKKIFSLIPLRSDAIEVVEYLKTKGLAVCLITGSMDMFAEIIAAKLDVKNYYYNTPLFWDQDNKIAGFDYKHNQAQHKLDQFMEFCKQQNLLPEECVAVGDSANDYELFKITGNGIAVRTKAEDKMLEKVAWKVIYNLSELKEII